MDAKELFKKYTEIKQVIEKSNLPLNDMYSYLSGWLDCANFVLKGENND